MSGPGWYPDPQYPGISRWWDGQVWTAHTQQAAANGAGAHNGVQQTAVRADASITREIGDAEAKLASLRKELEAVEEAIEVQSFGFYRPKYGFQRSDEYAAKLREIRERQKELLKKNQATQHEGQWVVGGSSAAGAKMMLNVSKLVLRAFNGDCDAAIAKAKYDNVLALEQRIAKARTEVEKLADSYGMTISNSYFELKLAELHLVHEHREKLHEEKEKQREERERLRDEQKAEAEIEAAREEAELEEDRYQKALEKARAELGDATGKQHEKLEGLVNKLEEQLADALDRKAKAIARAQLTKSGHVYVLSNIGAFGPDIYKVGLTRRLDPLERVDELGSASVPFPFDVHAIIFAEDAPGLERAIHLELAAKRVNLANNRKEFFHVSLEEIQKAVEKHHGLVSFVLEPDAEDWRKTRAMLDAHVMPALEDMDV